MTCCRSPWNHGGYNSWLRYVRGLCVRISPTITQALLPPSAVLAECADHRKLSVILPHWLPGFFVAWGSPFWFCQCNPIKPLYLAALMNATMGWFLLVVVIEALSLNLWRYNCVRVLSQLIRGLDGEILLYKSKPTPKLGGAFVACVPGSHNWCCPNVSDVGVIDSMSRIVMIRSLSCWMHVMKGSDWFGTCGLVDQGITKINAWIRRS